MTFEYKGESIGYKVQRSTRRTKTVEIKVEPPDVVTVMVPERVTDEQVKEIVAKKAKWIYKKVKEAKNYTIPIKEKQYIQGELFLYKGEKYPLEIVRGRATRIQTMPSVTLTKGTLQVITSSKDKTFVKKAVELWFRNETIRMTEEKIAYYSRFFTKAKTQPRKITVKEMKKQWGSCSSLGDITINWRCSMAPPEVFDYIIVHELCHLVQMNHSKEFWKLVATILPDYKKSEEWLKINGLQMNL